MLKKVELKEFMNCFQATLQIKVATENKVKSDID